MTEQEKDSAIKKINERYTDICRNFGPNSGVAKDYRNAMELTFGEDNLHRAKGRKSSAPKKKESAADMGIDLASRDKNVLKTLDDDKLEALLSKHTAGEIRKAAKEEARQESQATGRDVSVDEVLEAMDYVYDVEENDPDEIYYAIQTYWNAVGAGNPRPSYVTLRDIIENNRKVDEAYANGDVNQAQDLVGAMHRHLKENATNISEVYF